MRIELVVFDLAGTTVHDPGAVNGCFRAALSAAGVNVAMADVNAVMGLPKPDAIRRLVAGTNLTVRIAEIHDDFQARMVEFYRTDPGVAEITGTTALFGKLRAAGVKVAVNTGFSRPIVATLLDRLGWERNGLIQASVTSDEVARGRPHPDMILHLMRELNVPNAVRVAKVGDTPADLEEGTAAGCGLVIGVISGSHTREQLESWPHTHLIDSIADADALLGV
jgi:phosphonatase-like hydrolase